MTAAQQRASAVLRRLPDGPVVGAEVGVFDGRMSRYLLERPGLTLYMVDRWDAPLPSYVASGDPRATLDAREMAGARRVAEGATAFAGDRAHLLQAASLVAATTTLQNTSLDFVFIDADHSYEAVRADIVAWLPRLKPGGLLCGHDYGDPAFPGVRQAVDEAFGDAVDTGDNWTWFVRLP